jgi:hypothetical protein
LSSIAAENKALGTAEIVMETEMEIEKEIWSLHWVE